MFNKLFSGLDKNLLSDVWIYYDVADLSLTRTLKKSLFDEGISITVNGSISDLRVGEVSSVTQNIDVARFFIAVITKKILKLVFLKNS